MKYVATIDGREILVDVVDDNHVSVDGVLYEVDFTSVSGQPVYSVLVDGSSYEGYVYPDDNVLQVVLHGTLYPVQVEDEREKRLRATAGGNIALTGDTPVKSPMPGMVIAISVEEGQQVTKGEAMIILESMKMQNELRAPRDGVVTRLRIKTGESVERNQVLCYVANPK
jgi:biotin carboxyl carrier protein